MKSTYPFVREQAQKDCQNKRKDTEKCDDGWLSKTARLFSQGKYGFVGGAKTRLRELKYQPTFRMGERSHLFYVNTYQSLSFVISCRACLMPSSFVILSKTKERRIYTLHISKFVLLFRFQFVNFSDGRFFPRSGWQRCLHCCRFTRFSRRILDYREKFFKKFSGFVRVIFKLHEFYHISVRDIADTDRCTKKLE